VVRSDASQAIRDGLSRYAELSRHDPDVADWNKLPENEKKLYARMMEVFAGFVEHTDHHIGRLLGYLEELGELDNTLIMVLSDNGASAEGGPHVVDEHHRARRGCRAHEDVHVGQRRPTLIVVHRDRSMPLGDVSRSLERSVGDDRRPHTLIGETLEREFRHFAGAEDHRALAGERSEDLLRQLNGRRAHRRGASGHRRLVAHASRDAERRLK
jgi:hypothetical protein